MKNRNEISLEPWPVLLGVRWYPKRLIAVYAVLAVITPFLMLYVDHSMILWVRDWMTSELTKLSQYGTLLGDAAQYLTLSMLLFLIFKYLPAQKLGRLGEEKLYLQQSSLFAFMAFIFSGVLIHLGKFSFGRQRPYNSDNLEALVFSPLNIDSTFQAFPSGHSQTIFTLVALLSLFWPRYNWFYLLLGLSIAFTRITLYNHFLSDIIVGGFIGITGVALTHRFLYSKGALPFQMKLVGEPMAPDEGLIPEER